MDGGQHWQTFFSGEYITDLRFNPLNSNKVFVTGLIYTTTGKIIAVTKTVGCITNCYFIKIGRAHV